MPIHVNYFPLPTQLLAVFERRSSKDEVTLMSCPVVALTLNELGDLGSMCAVPKNDYFVPVELAHQHLHRAHGGLFKFSHYEYKDSFGEQVKTNALPNSMLEAEKHAAAHTDDGEEAVPEKEDAVEPA